MYAVFMTQQASRTRVGRMRYVVVDLAGNQRESFDSRAELVEELQEVLRASPRSLRSLYVLTYDEGREIGGAQRADELLAGVTRSRSLILDSRDQSAAPRLSSGATAPI